MNGRAIVLIALSAFLVSCGPPPEARTTFLQSVDLIDMTDEMAQRFAADPAISSRMPDDDAWVISIDRMVNRTNQIIPDGEKWLYLNRLRALLAQSNIAQEKSLLWVIPPERWSIVRSEHPEAEEPYGLRLPPTHLLTATFLALTNTSAAGRTDTYHCGYELIELGSGSIVWEGSWEVKRATTGRTWD